MSAEEYTLLDAELLERDDYSYKYLLWVPEETSIIIGRSNEAGSAVFTENALADGVEVYQRPSGGESVVISPNTLIVSIGKNGDKFLKSTEYFQLYNGRIKQGLESLGIGELKMEGISDLTLNGKKILGCSIYRNKSKVFYHAVINVSESTDLLMRYLRYPKRTPEYRGGRNHAEFVTSLHNEGFNFSMEELKRVIAAELVTPV